MILINRVGIEAQPTQLLDFGISTFNGGVFIDTVTASENSTLKELNCWWKIEVDMLIRFDELIVAGLSPLLVQLMPMVT